MQAVQTYLAKLTKALAKHDATEHTHRPALQALMEASLPGLEATNEPKTQQRENKPDYVIRRHNVVIGCVEAKDVGLDLKRVIKSAQIKRYLEALPNLIVTNYLDFVWFVEGKETLRVSLGDFDGTRITPASDANAQWQNFFTSFCQQVSHTLSSPNQLAHALAGQTRLLRDLVMELTASGDADLHGQYDAFKTLLVPELQPSEFADMYAQTATYGLFTARVFEHSTLLGGGVEKLPAHMRKQAFTLEKAAYLIPKANPFLREFFQHIANPNLSEQLRWLIEQIANSLHYTHIEKVLVKQSRKQGFEDPVFHFYETFLAAYDPHLRGQRGVYYTPEPVVDYIVRSVDALLIQHFGRTDGLADPNTLILDPATGTATFLRRVIEAIHQRIAAQGNGGVWPSYVRERLLPRVFGFELMMAPYTVAHLKLALQLQESGARFDKNQRLHVYLTNTLDTIKKQTDAYMASWITRENEGAEKVKRQEPIQVVLGNPPYSGISKNQNSFVRGLLGEYKKEAEGGSLKERKHWLNDDYVQFIRFAHDRVMRTGEGIVAFITNHGWLDNPTFRGMRASLMRDFDDIYVLDLHGNAKKKERTPEPLLRQGEDKNVFDIQQGVSITFLVKKPEVEHFALEMQDAHSPTKRGGTKTRKARIHHAEVWGNRDYKYNWLHQHDVHSTAFQEIAPALPLLVFVPRQSDSKYITWWSANDIFPISATGVQTSRDTLAVDFTTKELELKISAFTDLSKNDSAIRNQFFTISNSRSQLPAGDTPVWSLELARLKVSKIDWHKCLRTYFYRPFDKRAIIYCDEIIHRRRWEVTKHLFTERNLGLAIGRAGSVVGDAEWNICSVTDTFTDVNFFRRGGNNLFPLWLIEDQADGRPNLNPKFLQALAQALGVDSAPNAHDLPQGVSPEQVLAYLYAVLHAPSYRSRYAGFLKSDFPRIPLATADGSPFPPVWHALVSLGTELIDLHLLRQVPVTLRARFPISGSNEVEKPRFEITPGGETGRVWINTTQYFDLVPEGTWHHRIGGYQVCEKWLKDRKGRTLTFDDIAHYANVVAVLTQTQALQREIDVVAIGLWGSV
jgi:hypothetical protein